MKILISAAEASSDVHGAELLKAIRQQASGPVEAFGIGGPKLQANGLRVIVDARELLAMGFSEILTRLPRIFDALKRMARAAELEKPDVAVVMDYPDFHFRLARRLKALGVPVVYYIPPKVWAWRKSRVNTLRELFARILCILPFEEEFYRGENVSVKYVGNPLIDELPLSLNKSEARAALALAEQDKVAVLMPGSRPSELRRHVGLMLDAAMRSAAVLRAKGLLSKNESLKVLMPFPATANLEQTRQSVESWLKRASGGTASLDDPGSFVLQIHVFQGRAPECLVAADAGLIKSGTSTLEAGLLGCPHAVVYKPSLLTQWIFKYLIRYPGPVGLVNLMRGPRGPYLVNEILCERATDKSLAGELTGLLSDPPRVERIRKSLHELKELVIGKSGQKHPSQIAASEILEVAKGPRPKAEA